MGMMILFGSGPLEPKFYSLPFSVLVVDDVPLNRKFLIWKFKNLFGKDWSGDEASSGEEAIKMMEKRSYDIVFMDQDMHDSKMSRRGNVQLQGDQAVRIVRQTDKKTFIAMCTANCDYESMKRYSDAGANAVVPKAMMRLATFAGDFIREHFPSLHKHLIAMKNSTYRVSCNRVKTKSPLDRNALISSPLTFVRGRSLGVHAETYNFNNFRKDRKSKTPVISKRTFRSRRSPWIRRVRTVPDSKRIFTGALSISPKKTVSLVILPRRLNPTRKRQRVSGEGGWSSVKGKRPCGRKRESELLLFGNSETVCAITSVIQEANHQ